MKSVAKYKTSSTIYEIVFPLSSRAVLTYIRGTICKQLCHRNMITNDYLKHLWWLYCTYLFFHMLLSHCGNLQCRSATMGEIFAILGIFLDNSRSYLDDLGCLFHNPHCSWRPLQFWNLQNNHDLPIICYYI